MLDFHPLRLEDLPRLKPYFQNNVHRVCDVTPGTVFIWRDIFQTEYAVYNGSVYFKVAYPGLGETFTLPLVGDRDEHYRQIAGYCCRRNMPIFFYPVPTAEVEQLQAFFPDSTCTPQRDSFDYLYRAEDLKYFRGKKLSGQRNHVNKFLKTYGTWSFRPITPEDAPALEQFLQQYVSRWEKDSVTFREDIAKTLEILHNMELYGMLGGMLLVEDTIVGFSLGEVVGDTLFTHIEKADREYQGCYQMLVAQFAQQFAVDGVEFINREDDTGDPGLRTSKLSYHPVALLEKHLVVVNSPCDYCPL